MGRRLRVTAPIPIMGMDVSQPGEYIAARATKRSLNFQIHRSLIEKRPGTVALGSSLAERVQLMTELDTGSNTYFVRIGPTKFEELNKTTLAWTNRASAPLTGTVANTISAAFPLLSGVRILTYTNGIDPIRKYLGGGNDAALGGSPNLAKYLIYYAGYLISLNVTRSGTPAPWGIDWTDNGNIEDSTTGNSGSTELLEDSGDITGGGNFGQYFTVHKENAIYLGSQTNTSQIFRLERKETGAGAVANNTIISLPTGEQIFLSRDGFRLFNGTSAPTIDSPINDELRDFLNPAMAYKSFGKIIRELDEVHIAVPIGSDDEPSTIYKFNYKTRQVHKDSRTNITAFGSYKNTTGQTTFDDLAHTFDAWNGPFDSIVLSSLNPIHTFGYSSGVTAFQDSGSSDLDVAISGEWDGKDMTGVEYEENPDTLMRWQEMRFWAKGSGTATVYYSVDGGVTYLSAGTITLSSEFPSDFSPQVVYVDVVSVRFGIRIVHNGNNQIFSMKNYAVVAVPREEAGR